MGSCGDRPPVIALGLVPFRSSIRAGKRALGNAARGHRGRGYRRRGSAVIAAGVGILADDFFFTVPYDSLSITFPTTGSL